MPLSKHGAGFFCLPFTEASSILDASTVVKPFRLVFEGGTSSEFSGRSSINNFLTHIFNGVITHLSFIVAIEG